LVKVKQYGSSIFKCTCGQKIENPNIQGYLHTGGIPDRTRSKWWLFVTCPRCLYQWAIRKIDNRIVHFEKDSELDSFRLFLSEVITMHKQGMLKGLQSPSPCIVYSLQPNSRKVAVCAIMCENESPMNYVKKVVEKTKPICYVVVTEAWMAPLPKDMIKKLAKETPDDAFDKVNDDPRIRRGYAEKNPDRDEVLMFSARSRDGRFEENKMYQIIRNKEQKVTDVKDITLPGMDFKSKKLP